MSAAAPDVMRLASRTANRLRLVQVDFADQGEQTRRDYLDEEIRRAVGSLSPDQRGPFLLELQSRFPTWDRQVDVDSDSSAQADRSGVDDRELKDVSFLVSRLIDLAPEINAAQRSALQERLVAEKLIVMPRGAFPEAQVNALRTKLQLGAAESFDPGHVLELLEGLLEFVNSLDQLVWNTWKTIAPQSAIRRPGAIQKIAAKFATGDPNTARSQVIHDLGRLRRLVASLVAAIGQTGKFAAEHLARLAPAEIESIVRSEGTGILGNAKAKCWSKYVELVGGIDDAKLEQEIFQAVAGYCERLMEGV